MRNKLFESIIKLLSLVFISFNVHCQTLPLKTANFDCPNGAYKKDLENVFPFWIGTWKGVIDNKEYTFVGPGFGNF